MLLKKQARVSREAHPWADLQQRRQRVSVVVLVCVLAVTPLLIQFLRAARQAIVSAVSLSALSLLRLSVLPVEA